MGIIGVMLEYIAEPIHILLINISVVEMTACMLREHFRGCFRKKK